jgi:uncharacterized protein YycO
MTSGATGAGSSSTTSTTTSNSRPSSLERRPVRPGDLVLTHTRLSWNPVTWFGVLIRFGAWFRKDTRPFRHWNHVAIVVGTSGTLTEALGRGVKQTHIDDYAGTDYVVVDSGVSPFDMDRVQMAAFAERQVGTPYGWLSIVWQVFLILTGGRLVVDLDRSWFCSELAAAAMLRADIDLGMAPARVTPAHIAKHFGVTR